MQIIAKAGTLTYRRRPLGEFDILAIGRNDSNHWIFPMGHINPGESPEAAGMRETLEEAGVEVQLHEFIGNLCFTNCNDERHEMAYFLAEYIADTFWPEQKLRVRKWISLDIAEEVIAPDFHKFISKARAILEH